MAYMRLGDLLVASGVITQDQLADALDLQKTTRERLGDVLIHKDSLPSGSCWKRWKCSWAWILWT